VSVFCDVMKRDSWGCMTIARVDGGACRGYKDENIGSEA